MKTIYFKQPWVLATLTLMSACAQQIAKLPDLTQTRSSIVETSHTRVCPDKQELLNTSGAKLSEFFGTTINPDYIEGPVTYCLFIEKYGSDIDSGFAIELEHGSSTVTDANDGILFLEFGQTAAKRIKSSVVLNSDTNIVTIDLIYRDNYGLVQVKGSGAFNSPIHAEVRFYNFPSYEDAITAAAQKAKADCLAAIAAADGTAAEKCWGLKPALYTAWWLQDFTVTSTRQLLINAAAEALTSTNSRKLGEINIVLDDVMN
jgi:hypothetical protein